MVSNPDSTTSDYGTQAQLELQIAGNTIGGIKSTSKNLSGLSSASLYITTEGAYPVVFGTDASASPTLGVGASGGGVSIGNAYINTDPGAGNLIVSGEVGIGTTSPGALLDINNSYSGNMSLSVVGGGSTNSTVGIWTNYPAVASNGTNYVRNLGFYSYGLPISSGVTDSGYRIGLDIENFVEDPGFLGTLTAQYGLWARVGSYSEGSGTIQNSYAIYIDNLDGPATVVNKYGIYQANTTAKDYFGGNVGIGTTNPAYPLSVNGTVEAKEVIVQTGWSDYVFDKEYHLAPLSEVERSIKEQKHLPGMPSAKEVAAHGVNLGEMQAKLLAQIEQLALHQIDQEREIEELKAQNSALHQEVENLKESSKP